ncbi:hypothetical protein LTR37_020471 [Vermiconidia calcicola]|uniref:Uncharacterized protein n=1 Tax=Vermiconidia calcicola TaxID=1690605 RepID=A0ACC3MD37_9PEZI|nr:hypothetical protein LTR37_020471 [Vermiconidia calcicola]
MAGHNHKLDLIVVGAGVYGICAANTYLQLHPTADIVVLDSDEDAGGVWSNSRLYPQFWSQTGERLGGYPDSAFKVPEGAERYHDLFEAKHLTKYLEDYVTGQAYNGRSLRKRFVFRCWVNNLQKDGDAWNIQANLEGKNVTYRAGKVIVATGLTSVPNMPQLPGKEHFRGSVLHQKTFGNSKILTPEETEVEQHTHITILGGSKSASDMAYAAATDINAPRKVSWIIRTSGSGPLILTKAQGFGKYRSLPELGSIRAIANLSSANPYLHETWFSSFLHKTWLGEWLLQKIWSQSETESAAIANYDGREGALLGFEKLRTETSIRWRSGSVGILQKDDFWDVVARNVRVHRGDVAELTVDAVVLDDGTEVRTDVLLCATGWKQQHSCFSTEEAARLGLPLNLNDSRELVEQSQQHWSKLEEEADRKVLSRWPYLTNAPKSKARPIRTTPYRLYNLTLPVSDQSIAFLGLQLVPNSYHTALAQTLYAIAGLDGVLKLPPKEEMEKEVAFIDRWCARRYPVHGHLGNVLDYEMVSFTDYLLKQLGLSSHRTKASWWADMTDPVVASDYAALVEEYRKKHADYVS